MVSHSARGEPDGGGEVSGDGPQTRPRAQEILADNYLLRRIRITDSSPPMPSVGKCARIVSAT
jgi:hypothetical protein